MRIPRDTVELLDDMLAGIFELGILKFEPVMVVSACAHSNAGSSLK